MGSPRHPTWHTTGEHRLCRSLFVTSYSSKAPLPNLLQPLAASPIHPLLSRRAVQNAKPPTRPCLLCRQCHRDPKQQGAAKQHHGAKPKKAFLLLPTMLSPTATQGWASAMLSDESKQWGRAGRRNFWPMPICPLCTHPAPTRMETATRLAPVLSQVEGTTLDSLPSKALLAPGHSLNQESPQNLPSHARRRIGNLPARRKGCISQTQAQRPRRQMGAAASKFSVSRGSVFIKSCRSPARTGVSHSKISWQLFNLKAQTLTSDQKKKKKKKSIVSNFSARQALPSAALHLFYSLGKRKVRSQEEEKRGCSEQIWPPVPHHCHPAAPARLHHTHELALSHPQTC